MSFGPLSAHQRHTLADTAPRVLGVGTEGFEAPELLRFVDSTTLQPVEANILSETTNVWQMGAILRALVLRQASPPKSLFFGGAADTTYVVNVPGSQAVNTYSQNLLSMIDDMVSEPHRGYALFGSMVARPLRGLLVLWKAVRKRFPLHRDQY